MFVISTKKKKDRRNILGCLTDVKYVKDEARPCVGTDFPTSFRPLCITVQNKPSLPTVVGKRTSIRVFPELAAKRLMHSRSLLKHHIMFFRQEELRYDILKRALSAYVYI